MRRELFKGTSLLESGGVRTKGEVSRGLGSGDERILFPGRFGRPDFLAAVARLLAMNDPFAAASRAEQFFVETVSHGGNDRLFRLQQPQWVEVFAKNGLEPSGCRRHVPLSAGFRTGLSLGWKWAS